MFSLPSFLPLLIRAVLLFSPLWSGHTVMKMAGFVQIYTSFIQNTILEGECYRMCGIHFSDNLYSWAHIYIFLCVSLSTYRHSVRFFVCVCVCVLRVLCIFHKYLIWFLSSVVVSQAFENVIGGVYVTVLVLL